MSHFNSLRFRAVLAIAAASVLGTRSATATLVPGNIVAVFSNPALMGSLANDPSAGQNTSMDNSATAVYSINSAGNSLTWGSSSVAGATYQPYSQLTFTGSTIPSTITGSFQIGTVSFTNGTSDLGTIIFGATLGFYDGSVSPTTFLGSDMVIITTTQNVFGVAGGLSSGDDDYINICGNNSSICSTSIEAVESSEGGTGLTVNLYGTVVGDPTLDISAVTLAAGQSSTTNGFLGTDPAIGTTTPEPGTLATLGGALMIGAGLLRRRKQLSSR